MTFTEFISAHNLVVTTHRIPKRTDGGGWNDVGVSHWLVTFRRPETDEVLEVEFSQGPAHKKPPTPEEVLNCCRMDARAFEDAADILDFANEFGYSVDEFEGRKRARIAYEGCSEMSDKLDAFFTSEQLEELYEYCLDE